MEKTYKTYESRWHNPETGIDIVIARGDSEEYVRKIAQLSQFVPYEIAEYQTKENIREMYRDWRKENKNKKPNRAVVRMYWEDDGPTVPVVDTVGLVPERYWVDNDKGYILWWCSLAGLIDLLTPGNGSGFIVTDVLEFYKQ
jgi:hypothetical protein